jgi:hypothetical protein
MEEFEDFYEQEETPKFDPKKEAHLEKMKDRLARANYEAIKLYGIDPQATQNPEVIQEIVKETLIYFEDLEEYEKCADLKKVLDLF